uniref:Uncharacterized protein n=1 Tax=Globodera rostochiensis TaxID=31243 RepID=A0A914GWA2_GLORO
MDLSIILALFILSLLQASTRPQQQQQNVVEQAPTATATSSPPNPAQNQPLAELQNSLNKFLYQLQQTGEKVVAQPPPHPPLLFPAAMRHSGAAGGGGAGGDALGSASPAVRPLAPLGHPPLFPSSLLVPTPAHLPPTFRLPATVMEQHKAFPMDGSPTHPVVVFPVILEQSSKRHRIGIGTENNGTTETPTTITSISSPSQTPDTALNEQNTVSDATTVSELEITVHDDHATVAADANAIRQRVAAAAAPLAVPLKMSANDTTPNEATVTVTTSSPPPTLETTVTTPTPTEPVLANDYDGQKQHIFFVPGGAKHTEANGTRQGLTAVDLEAFLRSANITRMLSTWQQNNNNNNTLSSQDTKLFLALVERVLEQELARRLEHDSTHQQRQQQQQNNDANSNSTQRLPQHNRPNIAVRTDGHQIVLELPKNEADQDVQTVQHQGNNDELEQDLEERLLDSQKQLKTANTRLFSLASNEEAALVPGHRDGAVVGGQPHQKGVISLRRGNTASTSSSSASATTVKKPSIVRETDYKQREQAEFDRLLDRLRAEEGVADPPNPGNNKSGGGGKAAEDTDLLLIVPPRSPDASHAKLSGGRHGATGDNNANTAPTSNSATTVAPVTTPQSVVTTTAVASSTATTPATVQQQQQPKQAIDNNNNSSSSGDDGHAGGMMLNRQHQFWLRHGPKTKFERLVEDYRWRLAGQDSQNGLNDLIKALRNSNIGFFDRLSSPTSLKILRRVD